jgi:hypothetical protein
MDEKQTLIAHLSFIYRLIVASETLLIRARLRAIELNAKELGDYFMEHLVEETGHADLLEDDLHRLGLEIIPRFHMAELMAGSQYYLIEHEHPAALLGYMAALECSPMPIKQVDEIEQKYGEIKCLRLHAEKDPAHGREVLTQIEKLPSEQRRLASINYQRVLDQLKAAPSVIAAQVGKHEVKH